MSEAARLAELQRRYERLRRSVLLFRDLARLGDPAALHGRLLAGVASEFPSHAAFVGRVRPSRRELEIVACREEEEGRTPDAIPLSDPLLAPLMSSPGGTTLVTSREGAADGLFYADSGSMMALRFKLERDATEVLVIEAREPGAFNADDLHFVQDLLETLSATLDPSYSRARADRELDLLLEVASGETDVERALDESELSALLEKLLQLALSRARCRTGAILLVDPDDPDRLNVEAETFSIDRASRVPRTLRRRAKRRSGVVFRVLDDGRSYLANRTEDDPYYLPLLEATRSALAVPMRFQHRTIGVIHVESPELDHFSPELQRRLESLAGTATSFVRRAQLARKTATAGRDVGVLIKGRGPAWAEVEKRVERAAATKATVCLRGESGTGKELVAHAIHFNSARDAQPFVTVNCAAIPRELLESELFGHVRGAFTGALQDRAGQFQAADGGTIFLDEIGDLPPELQVKLLRVLQSGEVRKVGADLVGRVDVRVIAATSRDLERMMGDGRFREDLYYRLMVVPIHLPPLRAYRESIPAMVKQFVRDANVRYARSLVGLSDEASAALTAHHWPGNVRELRNCVEQGVLMADGSWVERSDLPAYLRGEAPAPPMPGSLEQPAGPRRADGGPAPERRPSGPPVDDAALDDLLERGDWDYKSLKEATLRRFEDRFLDSLLGATEGNVTRAAELAGVHRVHLHRMMKRRESGA